jgi:hypothetical protein
LQHSEEILEGWPLYRTLWYTGSTISHIPSEISLHCANKICGHQTWWERNSSVSDSRQYAYIATSYRCKNCGEQTTHFYITWFTYTDGKTFSFAKVGQWPALEERIPAPLGKALGGPDLEFYKRALRCRNFNFGLAALAYLRRVVENRMNDLLDLIADQARHSGFAEEELQKLDTVKASKVFDDKVAYAALILPPQLHIGGHNPIDLLHDIASDGIHNRPDDECIEIFDESRTIFERLFAELKESAVKQREFEEKLNELHRRKSRKR